MGEKRWVMESLLLVWMLSSHCHSGRQTESSLRGSVAKCHWKVKQATYFLDQFAQQQLLSRCRGAKLLSVWICPCWSSWAGFMLSNLSSVRTGRGELKTENNGLPHSFCGSGSHLLLCGRALLRGSCWDLCCQRNAAHLFIYGK